MGLILALTDPARCGRLEPATVRPGGYFLTLTLRLFSRTGSLP